MLSIQALGVKCHFASGGVPFCGTLPCKEETTIVAAKGCRLTRKSRSGSQPDSEIRFSPACLAAAKGWRAQWEIF